MSGPRPRLVVLRALGLGDLLTGVPALRALGRAFPDHLCLLAAPGPLASLAGWAAPVDRVVPTPGLLPLDRSLHDADVAVDLHGRGPESQRLLLPVRRGGLRPGRLISFAHAEVPETAGAPQWRPDEHEVNRWCRMLCENGIPADPRDLDLVAPERPVPEAARGATLIHPGAAFPARRWPAERFGAVGRQQVAEGHRVVITAGPGEMGLAQRVARLAGCGPEAVLGGLEVLDLVAVVAAAGRVLCGDTGVAHVATAVGTPSVVLCGPIAPSLWGPPPDRPRHVALWAGHAGDPHGATVDPGLLALGVDEVARALDSLPRPMPSASAAPS